MISQLVEMLYLLSLVNKGRQKIFGKLLDSQSEPPIANVESNFKPYALNISGKTIVVSSKAEGKAIIEHYLQQGYQNIDVGVMQVNYHWHRKNFATLEEMLIPRLNIEYAAKLLSSLYKQYGSWSKAVRYYHSANPEHHLKYSRKILVSWLNG